MSNIVEVAMNKITFGLDDWIAERAIIASNDPVDLNSIINKRHTRIPKRETKFPNYESLLLCC